MALKNAITSPTEITKMRNGMVTNFKIDDINTQKMQSAKNHMNKIGEDGREMPVSQPYVPPSNHKFRDSELPHGRSDFVLRFKCPDAYNKNGMSEHDMRPKFVLDRQKAQQDKEETMRKQEFEAQLTGKSVQAKKDWKLYHTLPDKLTPVARDFQDKYAKF